ncbi:MAG: ribosome maturation factor RimP [Bryobacteraceae bacterium]|nr:ribosome maturation factor RimP [Bryobacteraceae bacterium]MDW8378764.1 ribosome maturation factor RimP [Bryobacterales bacterium]
MASVTKQAIVAKVSEITSAVGASEGIEVLEVELFGSGARRTLRIVIDRPEGITHRDCELISRRVGDILDSEDIVPGASYQLEVSSPGVERKLRGPRDFERFAGQKAKIVLRTPVENQKRWEGKLLGIRGDVISLEPYPGKRIQFSIDQVERANLKFEW